MYFRQSLLYWKQKNNFFNFCWENLDIGQTSNMINKENKVRNIDLLFGFYYYNYPQDIIKTFNRTKFCSN